MNFPEDAVVGGDGFHHLLHVVVPVQARGLFFFLLYFSVYSHDDYDYGEVNQLLERPLKSYIKTVCCYPERVTRADYDNVMREFQHSEKVSLYSQLSVLIHFLNSGSVS